MERTPSISRPKGILKHSQTADLAPKSLNWNEENLAINELAKDSTMKITEPKTPYVHYNAETDEIMDMSEIPGFELGNAEVPGLAAEGGSSNGSASNSRRGSEASEKMVKVEIPSEGGGASAGEDEEDDLMEDEETRAHRLQFQQKRGGHYRNEAEAMKRAQALLDEEDSTSSATGSDIDDGGPKKPRSNGVVPPLPQSGLSRNGAGESS